jgi:hypothetical protein
MRPSEAEWQSMYAAGLREEQVHQLLQLKGEIDAHQRSEFTLAYYRQAFAKYLYDAGRLSR